MIDAVLNGFSFEFLFLCGVIVGLCWLILAAWCMAVTIAAGVAIHQKRSVRKAIKPYIDEFIGRY